MIRTTSAQHAEMYRAIAAPNAYRNEKVWTYLVAHLLADTSHQVDLLKLFCGDAVRVTDPVDIWFEAQPLPPRRGVAGNSEGNTKVDLAFGHVQQRGSTGAGIAYGPHAPDSWVCFVEAKCLADCSTDVSYDPLRNQLTRVIENLLCFQGNRQFPASLIFTLVTPQLFKTNPNARLYGYKMREYEDSGALSRDIEACRIAKREDSSYV
jgi:hypothetical protein